MHHDADGDPVILPHKDDSLEYVRLLDGDETILTLTPEEAVECGLGLLLDDTPLAKLGTDESPWMDTVQMQTRGQIEVKRAANRLNSLRRRITQAERQKERAEEAVVRAIERVGEERENALDEDPRRLTLYYDPTTLVLTPGSRQAWVAGTDRAIARWSRVQSALKAADSAKESRARACAALSFAIREEREYRRVSAPDSEPCEELKIATGLNEHWREAEQEIRRLRRERDKTTVDR